jgi:hypothetical protein
VVGGDFTPASFGNAGTYTLFASAVRTASVTGPAIKTYGRHIAMIAVLDITDKQAAAGDTLDVYVDVKVGGKWINAIHFAQALGNGTDAESQSFNLVPSGANTAPTVITADCAVNTGRSDVFGSEIRGRCAIVNGTAASFNFSLNVFAM